MVESSGGSGTGLSKGGQLKEDPVRFPYSRRLQRLIALILLTPLFSTCSLADSAADTYKAKCAACHGVGGAGDTMLGKNLKLRSLASPEVQNLPDQELFSITSKGRGRMPAFERKLSPDQIHGLVRYIRSLKK